jgi:hypothetical protein
MLLACMLLVQGVDVLIRELRSDQIQVRSSAAVKFAATSMPGGQ